MKDAGKLLTLYYITHLRSTAYRTHSEHVNNILSKLNKLSLLNWVNYLLISQNLNVFSEHLLHHLHETYLYLYVTTYVYFLKTACLWWEEHGKIYVVKVADVHYILTKVNAVNINTSYLNVYHTSGNFVVTDLSITYLGLKWVMQ